MQDNVKHMLHNNLQMLEINEEGSVNQRILRMVDVFAKGNKKAFGEKAGIQSGVLAGMVGGRMSKPSFDVLQKLLTAYPLVSSDWLLFGKGPMLKEWQHIPLENSGAPKIGDTSKSADTLSEIQKPDSVINFEKQDKSDSSKAGVASQKVYKTGIEGYASTNDDIFEMLSADDTLLAERLTATPNETEPDKSIKVSISYSSTDEMTIQQIAAALAQLSGGLQKLAKSVYRIQETYKSGEIKPDSDQ